MATQHQSKRNGGETVRDINMEEFISNENCFTVISEFRRLGLLTKEDVNSCMAMDRESWLTFMRSKAGLIDDNEV